MIGGLYSSEAAMRPKMAQLEILANNLANINSTGFKRDRAFLEVLTKTIEGAPDGTAAQEVEVVRQHTDFSEGSLNETGNPLDVAIRGRGFLVVDTPNGVRYTRNGNMQLSTDGTLVTSEGFPVMGTKGRIQFPDLQRFVQGSVKIADSGEVVVDKDIIGHLRIVDFLDLNGLKKDHQSLFMADPFMPVIEGPGQSTAVKQGFLEESNVEGIEEMVAMIELSRSFEADQKALQAQDASLEKSIEVGRL